MKTKNSKIKSIVFKILRKIILVMIILGVLCNLIYVTYSAFDITFNFFEEKFFIVTDGAMKPEIKKNDIIFTKKCEESDLKIGDIIVVNQDNSLKIRRITNINANNIEIHYVVKGDNNYYHDPGEVSIEEIQGTLWIKIPKLGVLIKILQSKIMTVIIIIFAILLYRHYKAVKKKSMERRKKTKLFNN